MKYLILFTFLIANLLANSQSNLLQSGPMVGYSEMKEVLLWVQTREAAKVSIIYWPKGIPGNKHQTREVKTSYESGFTAKLIADKVEPGSAYEYQLLINDSVVELNHETTFKTQRLWKYRSDPPYFKFAAGSCAYINEPQYDRPGEPYGGEYEIYNSILEKKPDFMIWLGDNVYFREPDWNSRTGIVHRYTHDRSIPELQPLLGSVHHYAIWDDHDYGPNNSNRSWWNKELTLDAFELFWANPSFGVGNIDGAITFFQWGDADFFLLDNRWYRTPNELETENKTILGEKQLQWLLDGLATSKANFRIVVMGGQFLNTAAQYETYSSNGFEKERQQIIDFIYSQDLDNVVFVTGDRHHTELSKLEEEGKPVIYDITLSPLNSGVHTGAADEENNLRVDGTLVMARNFGIISFSGPADSRVMKLEVFNSAGELQWEKTLY